MEVEVRRDETVKRVSGAASPAGVCVGALLIALSAHVSVAMAQSPMPEVGPDGGPAKRTDIDLRARVTYDSAVTRSNPLGPVGGPLRQWDVLYSPSAALDIVLPVGPLYAFTQGTVGYEIYQRNPKLTSTRLNLVAGTGGAVGPCTAEVVGNWARGQSRVEDLTLGVTQNEQETLGVSLRTQCASSAGLVGSASVRYNEVDNSAARGVTDNEGIGYDLSFGYGNAAVGTLQVIAQYQRTDYFYRNFPGPPPGGPGVDVTNFGLQYERPIGRRLLGRVGFGYSIIDVRDAPDGKNRSTTADVELTYVPNNRVSAVLTYARNASPSLLEGIDYILQEVASVEATYRLSPRLQTRIGAGWSDRAYKGQVDPTLRGSPSTEEIVRGSLGVSLRFGRRSTISLDGEYQDIRTDVPALSFDSVRGGLTVTTSF